MVASYPELFLALAVVCDLAHVSHPYILSSLSHVFGTETYTMSSNRKPWLKGEESLGTGLDEWD